MKTITRIFVLFITFSTFSQVKSNFEKYDQLVWKAMIQFKDEEYEDALKNFQNAFAILPSESEDDYFYAAAAALHSKDNAEAKRLIIESIKLVNTSNYYFLNFEEFDSFRNEKLFEEIAANYIQYQTSFLSNIANPDIYKEVESLIQKDQDVRNNGGDIWSIDEQNSNRLIEITKEYGWQKKGWLILWHQRGTYNNSNYVWSFFKPYIDNQISEGKLRKDFWARFDDEKSIDEKKTQIYGMYWSQYKEFPIEDIDNVDKRRASVGLPPLHYMHKVYGIELPQEYK